MQVRDPRKKGRKPKVLLLLVFFLLLMPVSYAQVRTITGIVSSSDTKETLPGTSVLIKGSTTGSISDINGRYVIKVSQSPAVLIFSYVGYQSQEVSVGDKLEIDIELQVQKTALDEVVVIGYGTVRKRDLSGSVGSVKSEDIIKITALNPVQSLQGKVAGGQVTSS